MTKDFIKELEADNISYLSLSPENSHAINEVLEEAQNFFSLPSAVKDQSGWPKLHSGYRQLGVEYSQAAQRPDLNESFSFQKNEESEIKAKMHQSAKLLYGKMAKLAASFDVVTQDILSAIADEYTENPQLLSTELSSWLQINYYQAKESTREILQDRHDDGHIMTFAFSKKPGLEVFLRGSDTAVPVNILSQTAIIMPGEILALLTGNKISALEHQVRKYPEVSERLSLMYFVNPDIGQKINPWLANGFNEKIDISNQATQNPLRHGLPPL